MPLVYVSLRTKKEDIVKIAKDNQLNPNRMFFVDIAGDKVTDSKNTLSIMKPTDLNSLQLAIGNQVASIKGESYLIFDSIPTLSIL